MSLEEYLATAYHPDREYIDGFPVLAVEILSPEDSFTAIWERIADLQGMDVGTIWILDPKTRTGQMCSGATWTTAERLTIEGTPIYVELPPSVPRAGRVCVA